MEDKGKAIDSAVEIYRTIDTTPVYIGVFGNSFALRLHNDAVLPIAVVASGDELLASRLIASTELETVRGATLSADYIFGICHTQPSDEWWNGYLIIAEHDGSTDRDSIYKAMDGIHENPRRITLPIFVFKDGLFVPTALRNNFKESAWAYPVYMTIL